MNQIRVWTETRPPHELVFWNPWDYEELERNHGFDAATWTALEVRDGWRKKGERRKRFDVDAWMAKGKARFEREQQAKKARWAKAAERYDADRHEARLALLEDQMALRRVDEELGEFRDGTRFPKMDPTRRTKEILDLEKRQSELRERITDLADKVGDPETVVDNHGRTPADRRESNRLTYRFRREREVPQLRARIAELDEQIARGKQRDPKLASERYIAQQRLDQYLSVPPLTADQMCADCATPLMHHGWKLAPEGQTLCPAWPRNRARLEKVWGMLEQFADEQRQKLERERHRAADEARRAEEAAKPKPVAVFAAGTPLTQMMKQLAELKKQYPHAELRGGRRNQLEVWPAEPGTSGGP